MENIKHHYFGEISLSKADEFGVIWENEVEGINTKIWIDEKEGFTPEVLDKLANFLTNLKENISKASAELVEYLSEDSEFIDFHLENLPELDLPNDPKEFVSRMVITSLDLWIETDSFIAMDFMISKEESDQILCVSFDLNGEISDISWES